ncbi:hypothetical protein CR203_24195 [Salipaludibacillus neizhouensis]|uniref:DUF2508 domain-containing protein n=1 Tax=Salipaludibacillus neizhouensis TaxID=885475 RepID=A0A3A9K1R1_9BACI|nr:YaaL family protein [Salipaludibacillus neizhouensis]RKL64830.1 hypothetical protein CR203_24195 [Salipaludibacillus neizhouensis]
MRSKKRKLRRLKDDELISVLRSVKDKVNEHESLLEHSVEDFGYVESRAQLERAKYFFLLREARVRKTSVY